MSYNIYNIHVYIYYILIRKIINHLMRVARGKKKFEVFL